MREIAPTEARMAARLWMRGAQGRPCPIPHGACEAAATADRAASSRRRSMRRASAKAASIASSATRPVKKGCRAASAKLSRFLGSLTNHRPTRSDAEGDTVPGTSGNFWGVSWASVGATRCV